MSQKGFSLIELLVVIAIVAIMSSVLFSILSNDRDRRLVRVSAEQFVSTLRETQNRALTGEKIGDMRPCTYIFTPTKTSYSMSASVYDPSVAGQDCGNLDSTPTISSITFENDISNDDGAITPIIFNVPFGDIHEDSLTGAYAQYELEKNGLKYYVCLFRSGRIEASGFGNDCSG